MSRVSNAPKHRRVKWVRCDCNVTCLGESEHTSLCPQESQDPDPIRQDMFVGGKRGGTLAVRSVKKGLLGGVYTEDGMRTRSQPLTAVFPGIWQEAASQPPGN